MKNWIRNHKEVLVFLLYAGISFSLLFFHENWRDEAQAWLLARDCSIPELLDAMKYEGHFLLWYFILMPFAKSGFPYVTTNIISWLITCLSVWLILRKAPFAFDKRVLLIFTFPLLYLYPVISRCYCLIPLAIVFMSICYKDRKEKPLRYFLSIIFLLNTHIIMAGMVVVVCIDYLVELYRRWEDLSNKNKKKTIASILIAIILMLVSVYPLMGCLTTNQEVYFYREKDLKLSLILVNYPLSLLGEIYTILGSNILFYKVVLFFAAVVLLFEVKINPVYCFEIYLSILWQCLIYFSVFGSSVQRATTIIFIVLYFKWIRTYNVINFLKGKNVIQVKFQKLIWTCLVIMNILAGIAYIKSNEIVQNFSNAHEMAYHINKNLDDNSIILCGSHIEFISSIIPYVKEGIKFYHVSGKRYFTYAIWDNANKHSVTYDDIKKIHSSFYNVENVYYIFCTGKNTYYNGREEKVLMDELIKNRILTIVFYSSEESISGENYILFKMNLGNMKENP